MKGLFAKFADFMSVARDDREIRAELLDSFEQAGLGIFWASDANGRLTYLSPGAQEALGCHRSEVVGTPIDQLFVAESKSLGEETHRPINFILRARNTISRMTVRLELGERDVWWEISGKPRFDGRGRFAGYRGSATDISTRLETSAMPNVWRSMTR